MSIVNMVDDELNTAASELIRAASNPPATSPRAPAGNSAATSAGNAWSDSANSSAPLCASAYATSPGMRKMFYPDLQQKIRICKISKKPCCEK